MKLVIKILIIIFILLIGMSQFHEYQHYNDFKELGCNDIKYKIIKVEAYCENDVQDQAKMLINYRDRQFLGFYLF